MSTAWIGRWWLLWLSLGFGLRLLFLVLYPEAAEPPDLWGFVAGLFNDSQVFVVLCGIVSLASLLWRRSLTGVYCLVVAVSLLVMVAEVFFWIEFESRLDRLLFHYLAYPIEVIVFLEDQFHLTVFAIPFLLVAAGLIWLTGLPDEDDVSQGVRWGIVGVSVGILVFGQPWLPGKGAQYKVAGQFASTGYLGVLADARYGEDEVTWLFDETRPFPPGRVNRVSSADHNTLRAQLRNKKHVMLIVEESFAGPVWEQMDQRRKYLPNFVELEQRSVTFDNVFATGSRTTRGLEAILNGFPPLPGISTTERKGFERLPSIARAMTDGGFHPVFLYGGWPGFTNFSNYWKGIGYQKVWSREDFEGEFETSWGVSDEALFARILQEMALLTQKHSRVFLSTLTVSHHRPYDFPDGVVTWSAHERKSSHAMAYADQALGDFLRNAREEPWFTDTVFIVVADHGMHPRGDTLIPAYSYRVPLLIHAEGLTPGRLDGLGSTMSLPSTLVDMFAIETSETFFGESLLCNCDTVVPLEYGYHVGLLDRYGLNVISRDGDPRRWVTGLDEPNPVIDTQSDPQEIRDQVMRIFGSAYTWYYGNQDW